jgi:uncharacterized protein
MREHRGLATGRPGSAVGMVTAERERVWFLSSGIERAAWHYPGTNGGCVIMAGGLAVTKEPGTDLFASQFSQAGFSVLAFDYRHLGESGGQPRQVAPIREQLADWQAAIGCAARLPGVDPAKLALWSFSSSGGHVFRVAARNPQLGAAIAQTPNAGGLAPLRNAARFQSPLAMARFTGRGVLDGLGRLLGRPPRLVGLVGERGDVVMLTTPDARDGDRALQAGRYPDWQQEIAAWSALRIGSHSPGRYAPRVACPLRVVVANQDQSALAAPAARAAGRAPRAELVRLPGGHYTAFLDAHEQAVAAELAFLRLHLLGQPRPGNSAPAAPAAPAAAGAAAGEDERA